DLPRPGGRPKVSWQAKLPGTPSRMLAADGKLFVVTAAGRLCCFGARKVEPKTYAVGKPQAPSTADEWAERASRILEETGVAEGYALALGVGTGRLAAALARHSRLRIIAIEPHAAKVAGLRQALHAQGLYGARIAVRQGSPLSYPLPPYLASLIVSEDLAAAGLAAGKPFVEKLFRCLRPYGGVACLAVPSGRRRAFSRWVKEARLPGAEVTRAGEFVLLWRRGALAGSAGWSHERADAGNSFTSRDELVKPPFGVLWFGGSVDRIFPGWDYTHAAYPSPLVVAGRMFIQVGNDLHAADVYTGRHLWTAVLPPLKTKRTGHNYAAAEDGVYVACDETCLRLDPATGARLGQLDTPAGLGGSKPEVWRDIRLWRDALIGSTGSCLVCLDRRTGRERWTVQSQREFVSLAIGGDKVFCADCSLPDRRGKVRKTQGRILALDARTTDVLWQTPLMVETNKRIPPQLIYCEPTDVLLTVCETVTARQGRSGAVLWQKPIAGCNPAMLGRQRLVTQLGEMFDPLTGSRLPGRLWSGAPNRVTRGCNHAIAAEHVVTIRDGHASYFDPVTCRQTFFRGVRSGCTNSLIPADGLLNAPNFARGCSCNYSVFTSLALVPRPAAGR
ncbi:PQQ-binding-like beta-propeller repeat protein, partial [bacterium]|nr:PQQ-binding-like beta-propeller repeat protein [bacterium]